MITWRSRAFKGDKGFQYSKASSFRPDLTPSHPPTSQILPQSATPRNLETHPSVTSLGKSF
ncbi:hypothetical protein L873DRAFT_1810448 [Choiromyces venosus 120613-1]|uniref:Uncharacterized protein n=1 Tax=Choiromyces venosus 120613-1 TaxID=1336337 RepID=A0A3N4JFB5_9PEZI|nr:hypothetical protein L873DRAFT_1810448 [Choiromyces venosus 120613-1]